MPMSVRSVPAALAADKKQRGFSYITEVSENGLKLEYFHRPAVIGVAGGRIPDHDPALA